MKYNTQHYMIQVLDTFAEAQKFSYTNQVLKERCDGIVRDAKAGLKLQREVMAVTTLINACHSQMTRYHLVMGYVVNGVLYCTGKRKVPNAKTGADLDALKLTSEEFDELNKYSIWADTGIMYYHYNKI